MLDVTGTVRDRIARLVEQQFGTVVDAIRDEDTLYGDLGGDSLDGIELINNIEEHFSICLDDDVIEDCQTFGDLVRAVEAIV